MGIQINGQTDTITAVDGGLIVSGADFTGVSAGTTAAPSISPSGDSNTGIFFPNADTIAFAEGGVEAARFDSSGNLGVGTVSPSSARLHVFGGGGLTVERQTGGTIAYFKNTGTTTPNIAFQASGTTYTPYIGVNNDDLLFGTGSSGLERVRLDSSGRVTMPYQPFVFVTRSGNVSFASGSKIPYDSALDSRNLTWNTTNNNFVVPVTGVYTFSIYIRLEITNANYIYAQIRSNGSFLYNSSVLYLQKPNTLSTFQTVGVTISVKLTQNDTVDVTSNWDGTSPATLYALQSSMSIVFNG